ncbi:putative N-alpha-acetyltransferase 25, NatB auxiliary subunit isoform X1 [Trypanosoma rangeli]|uniref:Putative N-alpha-acetyltransferase 25, NatB auxiliary subunit isoform X1 n=1 Tax=Trypanosoma rangeli TaxID=5698 RepID=A0A3S5IR93_TRYRA|nr:putative N-alpha-acetyltransferase 25, NatB auxiliary subunit isoform X1 [Trypanosoma rangeli]RNF05267.1 putative N-alpha-acetyltransferase 25, NatB auxiliary subunit isoform X1 [Trypanosoma rangeli]|eukprot:RNF05267.1 putative N-alpha-acetyltransferase 25, NatB auxiliary subunit isoform X1 [Trypanosoma rangeli]
MADGAAVRIFNLIDEGKLASAEGLLEAALSKHPDSHAVLAAEALLLLKTNQLEKAKEKAEALSEQNVVDKDAISALVHVLGHCCSWEALARTYERMKGVQNERNMMENLAQVYVRMGSYDAVQQTAVQLYRKWGDVRYQVWAVQANLCQVPPEATDHLLLKLSAKMLDESILKSNDLITPSTSRMYVEVLQQQRLYSEAVAYLCSTRGAAVGVPEARLELLAATLRCKSDLGKANAVARHLWHRQPDNWTFVDLYLNTLSEEEENPTNAVLRLDGPKEENRVVVQLSERDHTLADALRLCHSLQSTPASAGAKRPCRGPFMAELEVLSRQGATEALQQKTVAYAKRFYANACCFLDVSTYLDGTSAAAIYAWASAEMSAEEDVLHHHTRRILGLRCHVAMWGATREQQPDLTSMEDLLKVCCSAYAETKPLSAHLAWSEEGLLDGYITIALNIVLHAYYATRDLEWVKRGLLLLEAVDRRQNNPTWLIYSVCFARLLGLADVEAWRQLAFKSVQHDTMSHAGYWPLLEGVAVDEACQWNELAWEHYRALERDCSLLRWKVFAFASWPAMKDLQEYERRQTNSVARIVCAVHRVAAALRRCQTQRNVFDLMRSEERTMAEALAALQVSREAELTDNTDWVVARSLVLGNIHEEKVRALTDELFGMPTKEQRIHHTRQLLGSLMLLHDIALLEEHRLQVANAMKPKRAKKPVAQLPAQAPLPTLLCKEHSDALPTLPVIGAIAPALLEFVRAQGEGAVVPYTTAIQDALLTTVGSPQVHSFLFPEAFILTALLQVGTVSRLPISAWSKDLHNALQKLQAFHRDDVAATAQGHVKKLFEDKALRVRTLSSDLLRDVLAASRRR